MRNPCPFDEKIERTKEISKIFNKNREESTKLYLNNDFILLADLFEKFIEVSVEEFDINALYCISLRGLKCSNIRLQTLQDKGIILALENNLRGGLRSDMGDRFGKCNENKRVLYLDANNLYAWALSESLPYDKIKFD